jgi:hypothetical protein
VLRIAKITNEMGDRLSSNEELFKYHATEDEVLVIAIQTLYRSRDLPDFDAILDQICSDFRSWSAVVQVIKAKHTREMLMDLLRVPGLVGTGTIAKQKMYNELLGIHGGVSYMLEGSDNY